jgi:RNA polymerase sigma-70 factor (ECF subfamily)
VTQSLSQEALERAIRTACEAATWETALTIAIRGYGPELLGYLNALLRDPSEADDVFSTACENLWVGMSRFGWQSSFRTWAYAVTRNACISHVRGGRKKRGVPMSTTTLGAIAAEIRSQTASFLRTETKDRLAEIRAALDPDDQTLLILRIDRKLPWRDIAQVFGDDDGIEARAASLRKRFERLKADLREQLGRTG